MGKISKENNFKTPEGYFDQLTERIMDRLDREIPDIPKSDGFKVPDTYFDSLSEQIMEKAEKPEPKVVKLYPYKKMLISAASIAAVVVIFIGLQWQAGDQGISFEDIANMELEEYFDNNAGTMSTYEIAELVPVEDLEMTDILDSEWDEENIVEYLDDTIYDIDELNLTDDE